MEIGQTVLLDRKIYIHSTAVDYDGKNWDQKILEEVIKDDVYNLKKFKADHPNAKVFLDIGANIGSFAIYVKHLWPEAAVVCAEPLNDNYDLLVMNTKGLSTVRLINKAIIGSDEREIGFEGATLVTSVKQGYRNSGDGFVKRDNPTKVCACKVAEMMDGFDSIDFLKIDCEGSEGEIFESMTEEQLKKIKYISGEFHGLTMEERLKKALGATHEYRQLTSKFTDLGTFEAKRISNEKGSSVSGLPGNSNGICIDMQADGQGIDQKGV